ncbi:hypothetical protein BKG80_22450 [Mycobacteroides chelonae]|uniref:DUF6602 domain-containing protein n=1 Tax=Mycobacteroides chelonae TaxID=1774 RepID=UPI0008A83D08|nr:DUF6602 domain-containing protein [Mycobacteroides chelonae]MBF9351755.1 hypothetical protein [Mycobacteroides chelonae]OHU35539.1 hypothetical protein BKG80_22450 [Mycobacteroides chelonae]
MVAEQNQQPELSLTGWRFHNILATVEKGLQNTLAKARSESNHSTTIGNRAEEAVRETLRDYLPAGHSVGEGLVYDAFGDGSCQTDVVITNPDHPLSFPEGKSGTYVVDGVAAAGEVKACLNVNALNDCIKKGTAFKQLRMTLSKSDHVITARDQAYMKQIGLVPPYFAIAFENKVGIKTIGDRLMKAGLVSPPIGKSQGAEDMADTPQPPLDAVCILGRGIWLYVRPDNPLGLEIAFQQTDGSRTIQKDLSTWAFIETEAPLVLTLAWLNSAMPRMLRGRSVFAPYLIPSARHAKYMALGSNGAPAGAKPRPAASC